MLTLGIGWGEEYAHRSDASHLPVTERILAEAGAYYTRELLFSPSTAMKKSPCVLYTSAMHIVCKILQYVILSGCSPGAGPHCEHQHLAMGSWSCQYCQVYQARLCTDQTPAWTVGRLAATWEQTHAGKHSEDQWHEAQHDHSRELPAVTFSRQTSFNQHWTVMSVNHIHDSPTSHDAYYNLSCYATQVTMPTTTCQCPNRIIVIYDIVADFTTRQYCSINLTQRYRCAAISWL